MTADTEREYKKSRLFARKRAIAIAFLVGSCGATPPPRSELVAPSPSPALALPAPTSSRGAPLAAAPKVADPAAKNCPPLSVEQPELITSPIDVPLPPLVDAKERGLASYYRRFTELLRGKATDHIRIAVYGDSNLTEDLLTGEMRRVLQARYGDGGHGYVAFGKPWAWYRHMDVEHDLEPGGWKSFAVSTDAARDQAYGLGGIAAESLSGGARAWVRTAPSSSPVGTKVSRVHVYYLERPGGRAFKIRVDGEDLATVATERDRLATGYRQFSLPDGPHGIGFVADRGVRLFGVALERDTPGIVIDSFGVGGANEVLLARMNPTIVKEALGHRRYDLVVYLTGATEDDDSRHDVALAERIRLHQSVLPEASCLVLSPFDFAYGTEKKPRISKRIVRLARRKERIAAETGCAFWDFHAAMGGERSILKFRAAGMAHADLAHLNQRGAAYMARRLLRVLFGGLEQYLASERGQSCE
jgi:hypothetical protein